MSSAWTPEVWKLGPDQLVAQARQDLFIERRDIEHGILGAGQASIAGAAPGEVNESERLIDGTAPERGGRAGEWNRILQDLRKTEPVAPIQTTSAGVASAFNGPPAP